MKLKFIEKFEKLSIVFIMFTIIYAGYFHIKQTTFLG